MAKLASDSCRAAGVVLLQFDLGDSDSARSRIIEFVNELQTSRLVTFWGGGYRAFWMLTIPLWLF